MEKPGRKLKKLIIITGTTGAVYAGIKYLLPLVAPFFAGYAAALLLRPSARFFSYRLGITFRGKRRHVPPGVIGGVEFAALLAVLGALACRFWEKLCEETALLMRQLPVYLGKLDSWLGKSCSRLEGTLGLGRDSLRALTEEMLTSLADRGKEALMPFLMENSVAVFRFLAKAAVMSLVAFLAAVLSLQEMEDLRERRDTSIFRREFQLVGNRLVQTGKAWFKSQGLILVLTCLLCTGGMLLIKNPWYLTAGIGIGLLDAFPLFGTGTVLIPWAVIELVRHHLKNGILLFLLYLVCYFLRQLLEAKLMGNEVGLSPLETLAAVYVGLELFGFLGFLLGPLGLLLIEDLTQMWAGTD